MPSYLCSEICRIAEIFEIDIYLFKSLAYLEWNHESWNLFVNLLVLQQKVIQIQLKDEDVYMFLCCYQEGSFKATFIYFNLKYYFLIPLNWEQIFINYDLLLIKQIMSSYDYY